ncbi:MAG: hypothetical protein HY516_02825 [Candidatus Aenigmarchaeota archaeon]|nr:hypothetical protein [Candidatus Aenigmarchaeota archaeon]
MGRKNKAGFLLVFFAFTILSGASTELAEKEKIEASIENGVRFLRAGQLENGEFLTYNLKLGKELKRSPYITSLIMHSIAAVKNNADTEEIRRNGVAFLLSARENGTFWRFSKTFPLDTDDTFLSMYALAENGIKTDEKSVESLLRHRNREGLFFLWITNTTAENKRFQFPNIDHLNGFTLKTNISTEDMKRVKNFAEDNLGEDNLYYSWILELIGKNKTLHKQTFSYVGCEENLNALSYFSFTNKSFDSHDAVCTYLKESMIARNYQCCMYCASPYVLFYLYTRAYSDARATCLQEGVNIITEELVKNQGKDGCWGSPLDTSMATVSLINAGYEGPSLKRAVSCILARQRGDGGWDKDVIAPADGSREITTAVSLEALAKYETQDGKI